MLSGNLVVNNFGNIALSSDYTNSTISSDYLSQINNSVTNVSSVFMFRGKLKEVQEPHIGDVVVEDDGTIYCYTTNSWKPINGEPSNPKEIIEIKCKNCCAPIQIKSKYGSIKCEYCGSVYNWR